MKGLRSSKLRRGSLAIPDFAKRSIQATIFVRLQEIAMVRFALRVLSVAMAAVAMLTALPFAPALHAAGYPDRAVKVIVPFPAGGVTDIPTRLIAQKLSERLGQQFYIENIGGAGGNLGMANAARAAGDGSTILFASSSIVVNPSL